MAVTPEDLVRIVQDTISTSECDNPITFEPPDWAIRAMRRAYERGLVEGHRAGVNAGAGLYPEGG